MAIIDMVCEENGPQPGYQIVMDFEGCSIGHFLKLSTQVSLLQKEMLYVQEAFPFYLTGVHIINTQPIVESMVALVRPFINSELLNMVSVT